MKAPNSTDVHCRDKKMILSERNHSLLLFSPLKRMLKASQVIPRCVQINNSILIKTLHFDVCLAVLIKTIHFDVLFCCFNKNYTF